MHVDEHTFQPTPSGRPSPAVPSDGASPSAAAKPPGPPARPGIPAEPSGGGLLLADAGDALLAERSADGDVRAFAVLVRRHGPFLRAYAVRMLGSTAESDDVVQDTFVTAWGQLDGLRDAAAVRAWLVRIASRKAFDRIRARREHGDVDDHDAAAPFDDQPEPRAESSERDRALEAALAALPADQRRSWVLRELGGYSYAEIAGELGMSVSTVRGLLARARRTLIARMEMWR